MVNAERGSNHALVGMGDSAPGSDHDVHDRDKAGPANRNREPHLTSFTRTESSLRKFKRGDLEVAHRVGKGAYGGVWQATVLDTKQEVLYAWKENIFVCRGLAYFFLLD